MTEGMEGLGDWGSNPEQVTIHQLDELIGLAANEKSLADNAMEVSDTHRAKQRDYERQAQQILEHFGKDKYTSGGTTLEIRKRLSFTTPKTAEDKHVFFKWLQDKGIFYEYCSVNSQALNGLLKAEKEANPEAKVPGIQDPTEFKTIILRKGK